MKRFLYILLAFVLVSCTSELDYENKTPGDCIVLNVYNSPMTKADLGEDTDYERTLNRLDCFFYKRGQTGGNCVYYIKQTPGSVGASEIVVDVNETVIDGIFGSDETCDVFVIANLPSGTFAAGQSGTDIETLSNYLLTLGGDYDAEGKPFVMAGLGVAERGDDNNASGTIPLYRAASKVTVSITIPKSIEVDGKVMMPIYEMKNASNETEGTIKTALRNIAAKTYLNTVLDTYYENDEEDFYQAYAVQADDIINSPEFGYVKNNDTSDGKYLFTCEVPFYSYARSWEKGAQNAPFLTLRIPWAEDTDKDGTPDQFKEDPYYYYQILVNSGGRSFEANHWYDLTVNVGILGSTVEFDPKTIKDLTYYVLDWTTEPESESGDRYEEVEITEYAYLVVPETRIEINNATTATIHYNASHSIGIKMNTTDVKNVESLDGKTTQSGAFYVHCGPDSNGNVQQPQITNAAITKENFKDDTKGQITYTYTIPENVYSPVYSYIIIWLDMNNNEKLDSDEEGFIEKVTVVQYPPIYVVPDHSVRYSPYVNGKNKTGTGESAAIKFTYNNNSYYCLGVVPGTHNTTGDNAYMYTITVTSLKETDVFYYNTDNDPDGVQTPYKYVIGDPRVRKSDIILNDENFDITKNWVDAPDYKTGQNRKLQYYYPTSEEDGIFQVIAPKFRIVSFSGNGYKYHNYEGAKMRCASYQEDGYPAGRWRLPTYAEMQFVIMLQQKKVIIPIFNGSSKYFSSTNQLQYEDNEFNYMDFVDPSPGTINFNSGGGNGSVRCVYDEWYWGSNQDARKNTAANPGQGKEYVFTWGDKQIWDENGNLIN